MIVPDHKCEFYLILTEKCIETLKSLNGEPERIEGYCNICGNRNVILLPYYEVSEFIELTQQTQKTK